MDVRATVAMDDPAVYSTDGDASVNLLFITACGTNKYAEVKRTEENLSVRSCKPEAEVTNNKRRRSSYRTAEANYRHTKLSMACLQQQSYLLSRLVDTRQFVFSCVC